MRFSVRTTMLVQYVPTRRSEKVALRCAGPSLISDVTPQSIWVYKDQCLGLSGVLVAGVKGLEVSLGPTAGRDSLP